MTTDYSALVTDEWDFGSDRALAEQLKALVLSGEKTATTDLRRPESKIPSVGDYAAIIDSDKKRFCIIQYTKVEVKPFLDVDVAYARREGEDYKDIEGWRAQHRQFFKREYNAFADTASVICEQFKVVQILTE